MRIPRFAFALLIVAVVALGSSLTIVKVRAHEQGKVLLLKAKSPGTSTLCSLSLEDRNNSDCGEIAGVGDGSLESRFRLVKWDGEHAELGIRTYFSPTKPAQSGDIDANGAPETIYRLIPGEKLEVNIQGLGTMVITGELLDHEPPFVTVEGEQLDPKLDELRIASPMMLHNKQVLLDFQGGNAFAKKGEMIVINVPGKGLYKLSLSPMEGAVEGQINMNRISFKMDGQEYAFITGAPVARGKSIWILLDARYSAEGVFIAVLPIGTVVELNDQLH